MKRFTIYREYVVEIGRNSGEPLINNHYKAKMKTDKNNTKP